MSHTPYDAVTTAENILLVVSIFIHSSMLAVLFGEVVGILAAINEETTRFNKSMSQLNAFMRDKKLPIDLRHRLRE